MVTNDDGITMVVVGSILQTLALMVASTEEWCVCVCVMIFLKRYDVCVCLGKNNTDPMGRPDMYNPLLSWCDEIMFPIFKTQ